MNSKLLIFPFLIICLIRNFYAIITDTKIPLYKDPQTNLYRAKIYLGNTQKFDLVLDLKTSDIWVPSKNTSSNISQKYDSSESKTSYVPQAKEVLINYNDVLGIETSDSLTIGEYALTNFAFFQAVEVNVLNAVTDYPEGKIGLGYTNKKGNNFQIVKMLKKNDIIEKEMFTINPFTDTLLIGGEYSNENNNIESSETTVTKNNDSSLSFCNITKSKDLNEHSRYGWVCELTHIFFSDKYKKTLNESIDVSSRVLFDIMYPNIFIPVKYIEIFNDSLFFPFFSGTCSLLRERREVYFSCPKNEDIDIKKFTATFVIGGYGYLFNFSTLFSEDENGNFISNLKFGNDNFIFVFGKIFTDKNIMTFDYENKKIGFEGMKKLNYSEEWEMWMTGQLEQLEFKKKVLIISCSASGGLIVIIILLVLLLHYLREKWKNEALNENHGPLVNEQNL